MPGPFRGTMFFEDGIQGWSETHWYTGALTDYSVILGFLQDLAIQRARLLSESARISYLRVSDDSVRGDALVTTISLSGSAVGGKLTVPPPGAPPWNSILLRKQAGALYHGMEHLRGVPIGILTDPTGPTFNDPSWPNAFGLATPPGLKTYVGQLLLNWGMKVILKPPDTPAVPILAQIAAGPPTVFAVAAGSFLTGQKVRAQGLTPRFPLTGYNGINANAGVPQNVFFPAQTQPYSWQASGVFIAKVQAVKPYSSIVIRKEAERRVGRPFGLLAGRRPRRRTVA